MMTSLDMQRGAAVEGKKSSSKGWMGQEKMKDENLRMKCRIGGAGVALWQGPCPRGPPVTRRGYVLMVTHR